VNKKIASFIPSDIDPTEESLSKWLNEYGDVFGVTAEPTQDIVDPAQAAAYKKMNSAVDSGLTPDSSDDMLKKILNTNSKEELDEVLRQSGL
jgi:DNA uptake protein ComE-like DNA-binding protein